MGPNRQAIGGFLSLVKVLDVDEGAIDQAETDASLALASELDLQVVVLRQALSVGPDLFGQRLGEPGEVEDSDLPRPQLCAHRVGVADLGNRAGDDHSIEARHPWPGARSYPAPGGQPVWFRLCRAR